MLNKDWIGSNTTIIGPCVIGKNSVIAANSVVLKDVAEDFGRWFPHEKLKEYFLMIKVKGLVPMFIKDRLRFLKKPRLYLLRFILRLTAQEKVMQGPFTGMKFCVPDYNTAMLSGTWEKVLPQKTLDDFLAIDPKRILCIGAAEGYYAVGLGIRFPNCRIIAFEQQIKYQIMLGRLSIENDLTNLQLQGKCTPNTLQQTLGANLDSSIVICDVEGYEIELLDPVNINESLKILHFGRIASNVC